MASIELEQVTKKFDRKAVIEDLNLEIEDGKFTVLVGPSGCGKTTLLRMIAGLEQPTFGSVRIGGKDMTNAAPGKRDVAMVFQNYALYPTMTVRENIEFGLKHNKVKKTERKKIVESICAAVGLTEHLERKPAKLSGGQRQRVALARAMVKKPAVFLMDEPLSNLDAKLRAQMRIDLIELHKNLDATFVYVTHDQVEAMSMADQVILMNNGKIQQSAPPDQMYKDPNNLFVAQFLGTPPMNIAELGVDDVKFGFRPEAAVVTFDKPNQDFSIYGEIMTRQMLGSETLYQVQYQDTSFMVKCPEDTFQVGQQIYVGVPAEKLYFFDSNGNRVREDHKSFLSYLWELRRYHNEQDGIMGEAQAVSVY